MARSWLRWVPVGALAAFGCTTATGTTGPTTPTLIAVSPADFAGEVPCTDAPGAMRTYVVTIYDLGTSEEPRTPFALPSSVVRSGDVFRPTPCETTAAFAFVIPGHRYDAEVEAYDRTDLVAVGAGARQLVDEKTCGRVHKDIPAQGPATAAYSVTRFVRGCGPLETSAPPTPTGITVSLTDALAELACGAGAGEVAAFTVAEQGSLEPPKSAACGEAVEFVGLEPDTTYTFDVQAFEQGATSARWATLCHRKTLAGAIVPAACDPLVEISP
jgi:hypothetical protein